VNLTIVYRDAVKVRLAALGNCKAVSPDPMEIEIRKVAYVVQK
jgi:hypothetical protein